MRTILSEIILIYKRRRLTAGRQVSRLPQQKTGNEDMKGENEREWKEEQDAVETG